MPLDLCRRLGELGMVCDGLEGCGCPPMNAAHQIHSHDQGFGTQTITRNHATVCAPDAPREHVVGGSQGENMRRTGQPLTRAIDSP